MLKRANEGVIELIRLDLQCEECVTCFAPKLSQIMRFMMLNTFGKLLNMIRSKNAHKLGDQKPYCEFLILT